MEWKNKIEDDCCADELEEMIIGYIKAGFLSNDNIITECEEYIEDFYRDERNHVTKEDLLAIVESYRREFQNAGSQENYLKLESSFHAIEKHQIVALHYAGYTQSDGFEDCNEIASWLEENGEKVVGCCFYTQQDLEHILHGDSTLLYISFGNYFDKPTAEEVGQIIVDELKAAGLCVQWDGTAKTKIGIKNFKWDKFYSDSDTKSNQKSIHNGVSPILVPEGDENKAFQTLWEYLVPSYGKAQTAQGEMIRIAGRVQHEFLDNGCINWDKDFQKMLDAFLKYLQSGNSFSEKDLGSAKILVSLLKENGERGIIDDHLTTVLCSCAMAWIKQNPEVMAPLEAEYNR